MIVNKMTPGEKLYSAMQSDSIVFDILKMREEKKAAKKAAKLISDAKFFKAMENCPCEVKPEIVISDNAAKYSHQRYGVGSFISEDENYITLSFNGQVKKLIKAFNIITKL